MDLRGWRSQIAWVPQRPQLFAGTVEREPPARQRPDRGAGACARALRDAGAEEFVEQLPEGLQTLVGEGGRRLSVGPAPARSRSPAPCCATRRCLILDEPTAHLDDGDTGRIADSLARIGAGRTTLLIVHHPRPGRAGRPHPQARRPGRGAAWRAGAGGGMSGRRSVPCAASAPCPPASAAAWPSPSPSAAGAMAAAIAPARHAPAI